MYKRFGDVIGNWGPQYSTGPGPGAITAFGQAIDPSGGMDPSSGVIDRSAYGMPVGYPGGFGPGVVPPGFAGPGFAGPFSPGGPAGFAPWGPWCGGPPAQFSTVFEPKRIPAIALGAACGPLALLKPLGFNRVEIPGCGTAVLFAKPQEWFKIKQLVLSRSIACSVAVVGFTVGIQNMLSDCGGVLPGDMFTSDSCCAILNGFTAFPGQEICLRLENLTEQPLCVTAGLLGHVLSGGFPHLYGDADP